MKLKEFIITIEDENGFQRDIKVISTDSFSALKSLANGDCFQYNGGVVIDVNENLEHESQWSWNFC